MDKIKIEVVSNGIAYGKAINVADDYVHSNALCSNTTLEIQMFKKALDDVIADLEKMKSDELFKNEEFIAVHIMILQDPVLFNEVKALIENKRYQAPKAFDIVINGYIEKFKAATTTYLIERNLDLKDIRNRVLKKLNKQFFKTLDADKVILVCDELYPSLLMEYKDSVAGVIAKVGGGTSHGAILCKAREIPYVLCPNLNVLDESNVIIDTRIEAVYTNADDQMMIEYKALKKKLKNDKPLDDFTKYKIKILANVSMNDELDKVMKYDMYGVGLYRTEFIFMNLNRPLALEEQLDIYLDAVLKLNGKEICFRTFDIGDDKQLSYVNTSKKGVGNYRNNRELFANQIRALLAANTYSSMKIMFPMIETYDEFKYLRDWVYKIKREEGNFSFIKVGMMLETKSALEHLDDFKDIDFMSLGTNDLTSELYDIKRSEVLNYEVFIDDLISKLSLVVEHCKKYNIELSICGELAGCSDVTKRLYEIGIRSFSVSVSNAKTLEQSLKECIK